jgi:hypothetical protein
MRFYRLLTTGMALTVVGALSLTACSSQKEAARQATENLADTAKATGQAALAPAVQPVLDLLNQGESEVKAGNLSGAVATLGGFKGLWEKAAPVIQPLAGDKWAAINTAANTVLSTFDKAASPDAAAASSAISGLVGPLSALIGK